MLNGQCIYFCVYRSDELADKLVTRLANEGHTDFLTYFVFLDSNRDVFGHLIHVTTLFA